MSDPGMIAAGQDILARSGAGRVATPDMIQDALDESLNRFYSKYLTPASRPYAVAELAKRRANAAGIQQQSQPVLGGVGPQQQLDQILKQGQ